MGQLVRPDRIHAGPAYLPPARVGWRRTAGAPAARDVEHVVLGREEAGWGTERAQPAGIVVGIVAIVGGAAAIVATMGAKSSLLVLLGEIALAVVGAVERSALPNAPSLKAAR